jgi:hypothetical protein
VLEWYFTSERSDLQKLRKQEEERDFSRPSIELLTELVTSFLTCPESTVPSNLNASNERLRDVGTGGLKWEKKLKKCLKRDYEQEKQYKEQQRKRGSERSSNEKFNSLRILNEKM